MWNDVKFRNGDSMLIHIKIDKCKNPQGSYIDLFKSDVLPICPVKTLLLLKERRFECDKPVFMFENGKILTMGCFIDTVRNLLYPIIGDYPRMSHSGLGFHLP